MTQVRVNEHCVGLSACIGVAPQLFAIVDDHAELIAAPADAEEAELAYRAAETCPMQAIEIG